MLVKPFKIALFFIAILCVLLGLSYLSKPEILKSKNKAEDGFTFASFSIKYPSINRFLKKEEPTLNTFEKVKTVTTNVIPVEDVEVKAIVKDTVKPPPVLKITPKKVKIKSIKNLIDFSKTDSTKIERIQYPKSQPNFIKTLLKSLNSPNCRIIHYGDSQIEGDRITSYLRNRLQGIYGGNGPGFIPIKQVYDQISAEVTCSNNWLRYAIFDRNKKRFTHKKYGAFLSVSRFTPYTNSPKDSVIEPIDSLPKIKATIHVSKSLRTYHKFRTFTKIGLHYGNATQPISVKIYNNNALIQQDSLITDASYHVYPIKVANTPTNLRIELESTESPDFYGLTLDGKNGIQIDNVAMRGASGTIFTKSDANTYQQMATTLNPKLILMQYGGNTIPYLKDSTAVNRYGNRIKGQINWIKKQNPQAQVLFIGPTDMSTSINGTMQTYPLLPYLNHVLQQKCLHTGVAYWSIYNAMGGKNSMKLWVDQKLAGSDYTHFTPKGTKIIAETLFTSLYLDLTKNEK